MRVCVFMCKKEKDIVNTSASVWSEFVYVCVCVCVNVSLSINLFGWHLEEVKYNRYIWHRPKYLLFIQSFYIFQEKYFA